MFNEVLKIETTSVYMNLKTEPIQDTCLDIVVFRKHSIKKL
jgi:hypothetical protein